MKDIKKMIWNHVDNKIWSFLIRYTEKTLYDKIRLKTWRMTNDGFYTNFKRNL